MPYPVAQDDWILIQGESVDRLYTFTNSDASPFILTGYSLTSQFRYYPQGTEVVLIPTLTIVSEALGKARLTLTPNQTQMNFTSDALVYDIVATNLAGTGVIRLVQGIVPISFSVTH